MTSEECGIPLPPHECEKYPPHKIFAEAHSANRRCREAQAEYVGSCAGEISNYMTWMLAITVFLLVTQTIILVAVILWLRRARKLALFHEKPADMEETLSQRIEIVQRRGTSKNPGYSLVLPAYYWFFRLECLLCIIWGIYYGVCIWMQVDPTNKWLMSTSFTNGHGNTAISFELIIPRVCMFLCNALGTALDSTLITYLAHQNAGQKTWNFSLRLGIAIGILSGLLATLPGSLQAIRESEATIKMNRMSQLNNDNLVRVLVLFVMCLGILLGRARQLCRGNSAGEPKRSSVVRLASFKFVFAMVALGTAFFSTMIIPDKALANSNSWDTYIETFKYKVFPVRVVCLLPWALFFILNGLILYWVLWEDSQYWRSAGVRLSMFARTDRGPSDLAEPLLRPSSFPSPRQTSPSLKPRFHGDIIDFTRLSFVRRIGGGTSSTVWEARLLLEDQNRQGVGIFVDEKISKQQNDGRWRRRKRSTWGARGENHKPNLPGKDSILDSQVVPVGVKQLLFIDEINAETIEQACIEAELLRALGHHKNVIGWYGICVSPPHMLLVTELGRPSLVCTHSPTGQDFLTKQNLHDRLDILAQIASALGHLHSHGVVMRDLKCCNVLFDLHSLTPKLCDFGIATRMSPPDTRSARNHLPNVQASWPSSLLSSLAKPVATCPCLCLCRSDKGERSNWERSGAVGGTVEYMAPEIIESFLSMIRRGSDAKDEGVGYTTTKIVVEEKGGQKERRDTKLWDGRLTPNGSDSLVSDRKVGDSKLSDTKLSDTKFSADDSTADMREMGAMGDIFSLGVLIWSILYQTDPWKSFKECQVMEKVRRGDRLSTAHPPPVFGSDLETWEDLQRVMQRCWHGVPSKRPSASSIHHLLLSLCRSLSKPTPGSPLSRMSNADHSRSSRQLPLPLSLPHSAIMRRNTPASLLSPLAVQGRAASLGGYGMLGNGER
ncbi:hypothetical protein AAMO2058_001671100 [Amorphochlora amoebiformis]